jgi:hypothetical protein
VLTELNLFQPPPNQLDFWKYPVSTRVAWRVPGPWDRGNLYLNNSMVVRQHISEMITNPMVV